MQKILSKNPRHSRTIVLALRLELYNPIKSTTAGANGGWAGLYHTVDTTVFYSTQWICVKQFGHNSEIPQLSLSR